MKSGAPGKELAKKAMLLGSGELGKEVAIELMRLGLEVIACDRYPGAPAMQVAQSYRVLDMTDKAALKAVIREQKPDLVIPEVEALATAALAELEAEGFDIVPTALATRLTMDRAGIRELAAKELGLATTRYAFAETLVELKKAAESIGFPVVIKPIMSSSGKGQSTAKSAQDIAKSWELAQSEGRVESGKVIVEGFVTFESEVTLLTVRSKSGTNFCDPVGHVQKGGDFVESWQPHPMSSKQLAKAKEIALRVTDALGGYGVFGVELFLLSSGEVLFSEVSPRPHDTGMVTMATQPLSQFALHARAVLGLPVPTIKRHSIGACAALKSEVMTEAPIVSGVENALTVVDTQIRVFGKPTATVGRRMAVAIATGDSLKEARTRAAEAQNHLSVH